MRTSADHAEYDYHAGPPDEMEQAAQIAAELAALEAEIGRAVISAGVIFHSINPAIDALITRYRALLAQPGAQQEEGEEA